MNQNESKCVMVEEKVEILRNGPSNTAAAKRGKQKNNMIGYLKLNLDNTFH